MSKTKSEELRSILFDLNLVDESQWNEAVALSEKQGDSIWKVLHSQTLITKKQADTLNMCSKGYIPVSVARVTVSIDKSNLSPRKEQPTQVQPPAEESSSQNLDSSSFVRKLQAKQASTPIEDIYKSGEVRKLSFNEDAQQKPSAASPSINKGEAEKGSSEKGSQKPDDTGRPAKD